MAENENLISRRGLFRLTGALIGASVLAELGIDVVDRQQPFNPLLNHLYKIFEFKSQDLNIYTNEWKAALLMLKTDKNKSYQEGNFTIDCWTNSQTYSFLIQKTQSNDWNKEQINIAYEALSSLDSSSVTLWGSSVNLTYNLGNLKRKLELKFQFVNFNSFKFTDNEFSDEINSLNSSFSLCRHRSKRINEINFWDGNSTKPLTLEEYKSFVHKFDANEPILE